jgi:hypothetical protein
VIGYEPSADAFPSTVYSSMIAVPVPHTWKVDVDEITIRTELEGGATYHGKWNQERQVHRGWMEAGQRRRS